MANLIKIDNAILKRHSRVQKKRKQGNKEVRIYFLIVCEGEKTEPNYFKSFSTNVKSFVYTIDTLGEGSNTKDLVRRTIKAREKSSQKYDRVWVVFDKDSFTPNNFNGAIQLATVNNINVGWSNEAFELWYLLHFQYRNTSMSRHDYKTALEDAVNAKISFQMKGKSFKKFEYKKNDKGMFNILKKYGDQLQAIKWAEQLVDNQTCQNYASHNPCTKIHLLVKELIGESDDLTKEVLARYNT